MRYLSSLRFLLLFAAFIAPAQAQELPSLCHDDTDNFPWLIKDGKGLNNVLVDMASRRSGVRFNQTAQPWKRCLYNIEQGKVAGGFAASYSDERAAYAAFPSTANGKPDPARRLKSDGYSLYRLKTGKARWDGDKFLDLTAPIGSILGYASTAELRQLGAPVIEYHEPPTLAMQHLLKGHVPLLALMTYEGDSQLADPKISALVEKVPSPFVPKPYYVVFNKTYYLANRKDVEAFWAALALARESSEFKKQLRQETDKIATKPSGH